MRTNLIAVKTQADADLLVPRGLAEPADLHLLLAVPLEGPLDVTNIRSCLAGPFGGPAIYFNALTGWWPGCEDFGLDADEFSHFDGVICGGGEKPVHPEWVRSLLKQCQEAGVPFTFLGLGPWWAAHEFQSMLVWINHARRCIKAGDICLDLAGKQLERGADWETAHYPVFVMRRWPFRPSSPCPERTLDGQVWDQVGDYLRQKQEEFR